MENIVTEKKVDRFIAYGFDANQAISDIAYDWRWWHSNVEDSLGKKGLKVVIGISGGKDSLVAAALASKIFGAENVIGVMMPNGEQKDLADAQKVFEILGINKRMVNIGAAYSYLAGRVETSGEVCKPLSQQAKFNLAPRLRMATLYAIAQNEGGVVINTGNLCEAITGWTTIFGDLAGDFAPLKNYTVEEIYAIGDALGLPCELVHKKPSDGICGATDEDKLGFSYAVVADMARLAPPQIEEKLVKEGLTSEFAESILRICEKWCASRFKFDNVTIPGARSRCRDYSSTNILNMSAVLRVQRELDSAQKPSGEQEVAK